MGKNSGGYVYPVNDIITHEDRNGEMITEQVHCPGITRRDWLAGLAMQSLITLRYKDVGPQLTCENAYNFADAMIAEGEK